MPVVGILAPPSDSGPTWFSVGPLPPLLALDQGAIDERGLL